MTLIKSISGIRGTIGGAPGDALTPLDAVAFAGAYGTWLRNRRGAGRLKVVIGRDARPSGAMVSNLVSSTLLGLGIDVVDLGLSTTPTVEVMVPEFGADGGIILTASHNPINWNALKLLNEKGEFVNAEDGAEILRIAEAGEMNFAAVEELGTLTTYEHAIADHINQILALEDVDVEAITAANFTVAIDAVNSTGGLSIPPLLKALGVKNTIELYCEPTGIFPHNPEPLEKHLGDIMAKVKETKADVGLVVDPDVDRLALICEDGSMFGEEYTLVAVADYLLGRRSGAAVSNLSSSRALRDIAEKHGGSYSASAVGEVNVVTEMKAVNAVIGGEGNGGIIYPELHYGRDSLVGIALFLTHLAKTGMKTSELRASYPDYFMAKEKIELTPDLDVDAILAQAAESYSNEDVSTIDGVKINFEKSWVHLRKSNTEPIIRVYTEAPSLEEASALAQRFINELSTFAS
ncbi:phosphoglucosamine mutase [Phaeocystidibacter marisrubri]|uniref:Phosphoglucosamine mutase n=1 Tax=Phaeocystidibacter marisrubri TaxID=1577780 RepID=A0A6L3ZK97_9FLAO|nr:phosphoglucosamine mutase [Phaeocystidibacter marisrubri]KAB2817978.1 phosphoglucosamine mutase [Phaeocystidibacter marisrubri]GGH72580.1 phosphoglucosamine mutase [Phaeocystidibacter marisrubri]